MRTKKVKILLIDDNPNDRTLVERALKKEFSDIEIVNIRDSEDFKESLVNCQFDLVITDYRIRWTDGIEVLLMVKKLCPETPVIMFTATGNQEIAVQAMKLGLDDYVIKSPEHFKRLPVAMLAALERAEQKRALREVKIRYRELFQEVPVGLYRSTPEGKIIDVNPAFARILGFKGVDEILKSNAKDFFLDYKDRVRFLAILNKQGVILGFETKLKTRSGEIIWVEDSARAVKNDRGEVMYIEGIIMDITGRKKAEEEMSKALKQVEETLEGIIFTLSDTLEMRDPYTAGHQRRVAELSVRIAESLGLSEERIRGLYYGALIHDIGKIAIPAEILVKPATLSDTEYNIVKEHPMVGYNVVKKIKFPWPIAEMVLQHHERMDGSGYPGRLKGNQILLEARILAVADVVEAMSSHRPYRPALGIEKALDEIDSNKSLLYDYDIVNACINIFNEGFIL